MRPQDNLLSSTCVLVVADSNSKPVQRILAGWELIAIGGLNLVKARNIARRISRATMPSLRLVIFAVGINDKDNRAVDVHDCAQAAHVSGVKLHFQTIPQPPRNSVTQLAPQAINSINEEASDISYVRMIPVPATVTFQNPTSIHYTQRTVDMFVLGWIRHLNALNLC